MNTVAHDSTHMLPKQSDSTRRNKFGRGYPMIVTHSQATKVPSCCVEQIYQKSVVVCRRGDTGLLDVSVLIVLRDYCFRPALLHPARRPAPRRCRTARGGRRAPSPGQTVTEAAKASPAPLLRPVCLSCGVNITRAGLGRREYPIPDPH